MKSTFIKKMKYTEINEKKIIIIKKNLIINFNKYFSPFTLPNEI